MLGIEVGVVRAIAQNITYSQLTNEKSKSSYFTDCINHKTRAS
jgi:hypothetical protein